MLKLDDPNVLLDAITYLIAKEKDSLVAHDNNQPYVTEQPIFKIAKISTLHTGSQRPRVHFEGEDADTTKRYPYLTSYAPIRDEWVLMARVGKSYVILGKIH